MILAAIVIFFSALALGLLALLDRCDAFLHKAPIERRTKRPDRQVHYDAFTDRRRTPAAVKDPQDPQLAA